MSPADEHEKALFDMAHRLANVETSTRRIEKEVYGDGDNKGLKTVTTENRLILKHIKWLLAMMLTVITGDVAKRNLFDTRSADVYERVDSLDTHLRPIDARLDRIHDTIDNLKKSIRADGLEIDGSTGGGRR